MSREKENYSTLRAKGWFPHPDGSWSKTPPDRVCKDPVMEPGLGAPPLESSQIETLYSGRVLISYVSHRCRLIDPENFCSKYHGDAMRYLRIIADDRLEDVEIRMAQVKVSSKEEERTEIEVTPLP